MIALSPPNCHDSQIICMHDEYCALLAGMDAQGRLGLPLKITWNGGEGEVDADKDQKEPWGFGCFGGRGL